MEEIDIYSKYNAGGFSMGINAEDTEEEKAVKQNDKPEEEYADATSSKYYCPNSFYVKNSQGVSINGVGFCKGKYKVGQLVGNLTIDEELKNTILSLDSAAIRTNKHLVG